MRFATVTGALMLLAGCNGLPADPVKGDDQGLSGSAGAANDEKSSDPKNATASADGPSGVAECELEAKECYAAGKDPQVCDAILKSCTPPAPQPTCGADCDSSVRACFAKGIDAKTCDAQYHACLSSVPGAGTGGDSKGDAAHDPYTDCVLAAKQCFVDGNTLPEKCQALLDSCTPPAPANDPQADCELAAKQCFADGSTPAEKCQALLDSCAPPPAEDPAPDPGVECKLEYVKCLEKDPDGGVCDLMLTTCVKAADAKAPN